MTLYYLNLLLVVGLGIALCEFRPSKLKNAVYLTVTFSSLFAISVLRFGMGFDFWSYKNTFTRAAAAIQSGSFWVVKYESNEKGFEYLNRLTALIFGDNYYAFLGVVAFIILLSTAVFIYRFSNRVWLSTFMYITMTFFYGSMNYMRQYLALAIALWAFGFMFRKKKNIGQVLLFFLPYAAIVGLAALFHVTALMLIPVYFLVLIPPKKYAFIVYAVGLVAAQLLMNPILKFVYGLGGKFAAYEGTAYMEPLPWFFLVIPALLCALAVIFAKPLCERNPRNAVTVNMVIYGFVFWTFVVRAMLLERFSMYFFFAVTLLIAEIYDMVLPQQEEKELALLLAKTPQPSGGKSKGKPVAKSAEIDKLRDTISSRRAYAIAGLVVVMGAMLLYHNFGSRDGYGFHGVFPYKSRIEWLEKLNGQKGKYLAWWNSDNAADYESVYDGWEQDSRPNN